MVAVTFAGLLQASTPSSGTIATPSDESLGPKQTLTFTSGPFVAGTLAGTQVKDTVAICTQAVTPPGVCDVFAVNFNLPDGYWGTRRGTLSATVKWADAPDGNDMDLYIVDEQGKIVASSTTSNTQSASETASFTNPGTGPRTYRVVVVNWLSPVPINSAAGTVTFSLVAPPTALPPEPTQPSYAPRFFNYKPPSGLGETAGEPTLGVNFKSGNVMFIALLETLRASFDDSSSPAKAQWFNRSFITTGTRTNDPILFTDSSTGRTLVSQLIFPTKQSLSAFTDDDGESWEISQGSGINSGVDHQTIGGGRFGAGLGSIDPDYPNAVYYAAQDIAVAEFATSLDGGRTYGPAVPMYALTDCAGLHGHIKVSPADGAAYIPLGSCVAKGIGQQAVAFSADSGITWSIRRVNGTKASTWDPAVGVGKAGTVYFGYGDNGDRIPRVAVSRDKGQTWTIGPDLGAAHGIKRIAFPAMVAGDDDRAAYTFLGTRNEGEALGSGSGFEGTWQLYVSTTYDGGATWVTVNATGDDPVQRGNICDAGFSCPSTPDTRNLVDFMDAQIDARGRILAGYADGCVSAGCISGADKNRDGFLDARDNDATDKAAIARQSGGLGLLAAFDAPAVAAPAAPQLTAALQGQAAYLSWSTPDDGGSPITGYRVYRNDAAVASVGAGVNTYTDGSSSATTGYRVSAINAAGEGARSAAVFPTVPASGCSLPGMLVAEDTIDNLPNKPLQPAVDVKTTHVAEPYGDGTGRLHFTVATGGGALPPNSQWYVIWQRTTPDTTHDRNYVAMRSNVLGALSFEHGRVSYPVSTSGPAPNQGNVPTRFGAATGSYDGATGAIRITVPTASVDNVSAGASLLGIEVRTFLGRNDSLPISQSVSSDFSPAGSYTMVGNASCQLAPEAPTALTATATSGKRTVQLAWADNSSNETAFIIERSASLSDSFVELATVGANVTTYTDATVVKKTTYFYRVRAANGGARSAYTNVASVTVK
ncbi:MAG TPA: hypothetical protein VNJ03_04925 [Vicinamibacterales bacterium]|nr:hypothetical protein [Vicinamibacterales bacterium]